MENNDNNFLSDLMNMYINQNKTKNPKEMALENDLLCYDEFGVKYQEQDNWKKFVQNNLFIQNKDFDIIVQIMKDIVIDPTLERATKTTLIACGKKKYDMKHVLNYIKKFAISGYTFCNALKYTLDIIKKSSQLVYKEKQDAVCNFIIEHCEQTVNYWFKTMEKLQNSTVQSAVEFVLLLKKANPKEKFVNEVALNVLRFSPKGVEFYTQYKKARHEKLTKQEKQFIDAIMEINEKCEENIMPKYKA